MWPCTWWEPTGRRHHELHVDCYQCETRAVVDLGYSEAEDVDGETAPWPVACGGCGVSFDYEAAEDVDADDVLCSRSSSHAHELREPATGRVVPSTWELSIGALYDYGQLYPDGVSWRLGLDGRSIVCVIPGNGTRAPDGKQVTHWHIDSRASNCGSPQDDVHRCWVRHGDPTQPETVHVDKNGVTCTAGAGSIAVPGYHGFLHHGHVTDNA